MELVKRTLGESITYGENGQQVVIGQVHKSIGFRIQELKEKLINGTITPEEKEELSLLK